MNKALFREKLTHYRATGRDRQGVLEGFERVGVIRCIVQNKQELRFTPEGQGVMINVSIYTPYQVTENDLFLSVFYKGDVDLGEEATDYDIFSGADYKELRINENVPALRQGGGKVWRISK